MTEHELRLEALRLAQSAFITPEEAVDRARLYLRFLQGNRPAGATSAPREEKAPSAVEPLSEKPGWNASQEIGLQGAMRLLEERMRDHLRAEMRRETEAS